MSRRPSSKSLAYQKSDLKVAIERARRTGLPVGFEITKLPVKVSLPNKIFTEAGRIYGNFSVNINGRISVDDDGNYAIDEATASINPEETYNFNPDAEDFATNAAIVAAAARPNWNDASVSPTFGLPSPPTSVYGMADIATKTNRDYSFSAWGKVE